jgi:protein phosphatase
VLKSYSVTDIGRKRQLNQDYVFSSPNPLGNMPNLFIVADGMGGHKAGDYASRYTVETIEREIRTSFEKNPSIIIKKAIQTANREIRQKAGEDPNLSGMGTTVVVATIIGRYLQVANVGDSRLYIVNGQEIRQITRDHSLVEEMVRLGGIKREEARLHPDKNIITRAIGAKDDVDIDFFTVELRPSDYILMCSDGLTNMVEDREILKIIQEHREEASLPLTAQALIDAANQNGGKDNIAVVLVKPFSDEVKK